MNHGCSGAPVTLSQLLEMAASPYAEAASPFDESPWLLDGDECLWLTWRGDAVNNTLALMLNRVGLKATPEGVAIAVRGAVPMPKGPMPTSMKGARRGMRGR